MLPPDQLCDGETGDMVHDEDDVAVDRSGAVHRQDVLVANARGDRSLVEQHLYEVLVIGELRTEPLDRVDSPRLIGPPGQVKGRDVTAGDRLRETVFAIHAWSAGERARSHRGRTGGDRDPGDRIVVGRRRDRAQRTWSVLSGAMEHGRGGHAKGAPDVETLSSCVVAE
jgi:hypothetical protein